MNAARQAHLRLGRRGETTVCRWLESRGCEILARNWRIRSGELDIVARDGEVICFVEVKTRRSKHPDVRPAENLTFRQRNRNWQAARSYWRMIGEPDLPVRFDLVEVQFRGQMLCELRCHHNYLPSFREAGAALEFEPGGSDA